MTLFAHFLFNVGISGGGRDESFATALVHGSYAYLFFLYDEGRKTQQTSPFNINGFLKCAEGC